MKAKEITAAGKEALRSGRFQMVRINYANPDMVGHTGGWVGVLVQGWKSQSQFPCPSFSCRESSCRRMCTSNSWWVHMQPEKLFSGNTRSVPASCCPARGLHVLPRAKTSECKRLKHPSRVAAESTRLGTVTSGCCSHATRFRYNFQVCAAPDRKS